MAEDKAMAKSERRAVVDEGAGRRRTLRTLPEQIADDLGGAIARGERKQGERLLEVDLSTHYGVSRGPVREAFRLLAQRGLAEIFPRRGAYVVQVSLDSLVDLFNMRAVLMGLAARYFALMARSEARDALSVAIADLHGLAHDDSDPASFVRGTARIGLVVARNCGSKALGELIEHHNDGSAWDTLWHSGQIDFTTRERRLSSASDYAAMADAIADRNGDKAEAIMRRMVMRSRESAVAAIVRTGEQPFDERRLLVA